MPAPIRELTIVVPGLVVPWARPRKRRHADGSEHWHNKPEVESYLAVVRHEARLVVGDDPPFEKEIGLELSLLKVWPVPGSWSNKRRRMVLDGSIPKTTRPDLHNSIKGFKDAVRHVVYRDDAQVVSYGRCAKVYGDRPRLEARLTVVERMPQSMPDLLTADQRELFAEAAA